MADKQSDAVHYLQFVVTGMMETDEPDLVLIKILCGVPVHQPVKSGIEISQEEVKICKKRQWLSVLLKPIK
ncbi:hypothetical protein GJU39_20145 [Pedobacter petrophilus]|uniref:Uncharacterized protein n=1 Tax=Pedobacter petrophilus TaxID=1908241 RepID=A0A7K0G3L4_9SPHI|nr:contractile injection system tape measure protein [Pedobacter petrophilus]MRX78398.1 hypothetical protein [Pedobacter petrophilus]